MCEKSKHSWLFAALLAFLFVLFALAAPAQTVVISQIYGGGGNTGATLRNDFIELFNRGPAAVDVTGWSVQYASATGDTWQVTPLTGSIAPGGYYLVQQAQGAGGSVNLPVPDATGSIPMSATAGKVALASDSTPLSGASPAGPQIVDLVAYSGLSNTTALARRSAGCGDGFSTAVPNPRNSASPPNSCGAAPEPVAASISEIQGPGSVSPLVGKLVTTRGVVTATKRNGFFIQTPDAEADSDPATSEGLFVFTSTAPPPGAAGGNLVSVTGTVAEFAPASDPHSPTLTELIEPSVTVVTSNNPLPAPVTLTTAQLSPASGLDQLERFEGMRVHVPSLTVVAPADNGVYYGVLPGVPRPFREPGVRLPDPLPEGGRPYIPRFDANPERLRVDRSVTIWVTTGDTVTNLAGLLDYGFRTYTILLSAVPIGPPGPATLRPAPAPRDDEISIASLNLQQFSNPTEQRLAKAALAIRTVLNSPDILAVQEVENLAALEALAARLGSNYQAHLVEGNDPSGIDVGFLVKTTRVKVVDVRQEGKATMLGRDPVFDRHPLVLRATASALPLTVIANHLRSRIGLETPGNDAVVAKRKAQAEFLAGMIQSRRAENLVVLGDFNAFEFNDGYVDVLGTIRGRPARPEQVLAATADLVNPDLINLIGLLPRRERYSYIEDGNAAALDHILVNRNLAPRVTRFAYARGNADSPESWRNDPSRPERISDHDAPVAYFSLAATPPAISPAGVTSVASFEPSPVAPGALVSVFGSGLGPAAPATLALSPDRQFVTNSLAGTRVLFDGTPAPLVYVSAGQVSAAAPYALAGKTTTELAVEYSGRLTNKITLPVEPAAPALFTAGASGCGQGAILNQDNTANGPANPALRGSVVTLYGAGGGQTEPSLADGRVIGRDLPRLTLPVVVRIGGQEAEVLYAGGAPGLVHGVMQVNARVPASVVPGPNAPVLLAVGGTSSQDCVVMAVR